MRFRMGPLEIGIILVIVLIIFGVGKLPQVGESLGKGLRAFRQGQQDEDDDKKKESVEAVKAETTPAAPTAEMKAEEPKAEAPKMEAKETLPANTSDED